MMPMQSTGGHRGRGGRANGREGGREEEGVGEGEAPHPMGTGDIRMMFVTGMLPAEAQTDLCLLIQERKGGDTMIWMRLRMDQVLTWSITKTFSKLEIIWNCATVRNMFLYEYVFIWAVHLVSGVLIVAFKRLYT